MSFIGNRPDSFGYSTTSYDHFVGTGSQTVYTLSRPVTSNSDIFVTVNNVPQDPGVAYYVTNLNTLTFTSAPSSSLANNIVVVYRNFVQTGMALGANTVTSFTIAPGAVQAYQISSVSNTSISGNIVSSQITSVSNTQIAGQITSTQIDVASANGTGAILVPVGNTAQRPAGANGQFRYNTTSSSFEGYTANGWGNFINSSAGIIAALTYTPSNSANQTSFSIRSTVPGQIDFPLNSWSNVNTTYYKWDLPAAGNYVLYMTVRARVWSVNGFGKVRLYNNTAGAAVTNSDTMLLESSSNSNLLNVMCSGLWQFTATGATTLYLQGYATQSSGIGIQSDGNGYNEFGWIRIS